MFDDSKIADCYAQSDEQTKKLMQDSALVIIDYNDAIDNGFVELTNDLKDLFNEEYN